MKAFGDMENANLELTKDHTQSHGTLFTVSYIPDIVFPNRSEETDRLREEIQDLKDGIDALRGVVKKLIDGVFRV